MKVELITFLYDKKLVEDLGLKSADIPVKLTIDTDSIDSIRERIEDEEIEVCTKTCIIYMKSGESFQVGKGYEYMCKLWLKDDLYKVLKENKEREDSYQALKNKLGDENI